MWTPIARDLGVPWRVVEAMHWHMGRDEMSRRAGVTPFSLVGANGPSPVSTSGPSISTTGLGGGASSFSAGSGGYGGGGGGNLESPEGIRIKSEGEARGEPRRRTRREGGVRGGTVLPSLAEMDVGVGVYDDEEEDEEE